MTHQYLSMKQDIDYLTDLLSFISLPSPYPHLQERLKSYAKKCERFLTIFQCIYIMGIGGTAIALAGLLVAQGYKVTGSDGNIVFILNV